VTLTARPSSTAPPGKRESPAGPSRPGSENGGGARGLLVRYVCYVDLGLVVLLGSVTALGLLERWLPPLELLTVFRLQYAVLLAAAALLAIALRRFRLGLVAALLLGVNLLVISQVSTASVAPVEGTRPLRMLIVNVRHGNEEYDRLARLIRETDPDVVGVIELTPAWVNGLDAALGDYPERVLEAEQGAYGIGLYSRAPLAEARIERFPPDGPATVVASVDMGGRPVGLVVTHVHTPFAGGIHRRHLQALAAGLPQLGDHLAVCGDFNTVPWSHALRDFAAETGLRSIHGRFGLSGTWPAGALVLRIPIDNCLVSEGVAVVERFAGPDIGSDHLPLIVDLAPAREG
jgi:endonuclease/exonuclease/phosphatase (EEP) superfamily protein YafD